MFSRFVRRGAPFLAELMCRVPLPSILSPVEKYLLLIMCYRIILHLVMFLDVGGILRRVPLTLRVKRDPQRPALLNRLLQGAVDFRRGNRRRHGRARNEV